MGISVYVLCYLYAVLTVECAVTPNTGYFWHVTDFHYDFTYHGRQLSCNPDNLPQNPGQYGDFWCDSPWSLINSSIYAMAKIKSDADFALWTGDTVFHGKDKDLSYSINADIIENTTDLIKTVLPRVPVYATFGNHDYWPSNQFPPDNNQLYNDSLARWKDWINDPSQDVNIRKGGYYTIRTSHGLRIIALNTNLYYTSNKAVINTTDPGEQLAWLNATLKRARANGEKVLITAHIPPGVHTPNGMIWMHDDYHVAFVDILKQHTDITVAMHFGHDHADGFKIIRSTDGRSSAPIFIAPSVTPWRYKIPGKIGPAHNPCIRLVKYDRTTSQHLEIRQYHLDLEQANREGKANWKLEYQTSADYHLNTLTATDLTNLAKSMEQSSSKEFRNYWNFYTGSPPDSLKKPCDKDCHAKIVCGFTEFDMKAFDACRERMVTSGTIELFNFSIHVVIGLTVLIKCFLI